MLELPDQLVQCVLLLKLIKLVEDISHCVPKALHELIVEVFLVKKDQCVIIVVKLVVYFTIQTPYNCLELFNV